MFKKILIAAPTSNHKSYCDFDWINNTLSLQYPADKLKIVLFDNSEDNGEYVNRLNSHYKDTYGNNDQFECIKSDTTFCDGLISKMCKGHNDCRDYALSNGFDAMLHLETDVFIKPHFLQELILANKKVVGAVYYRDNGRFRKLMVQKRIFRAPKHYFSAAFDQSDDLYFIDGTVKEASHIGLGAVLIDSSVLKQIEFRYNPDIRAYPDSFFMEDCFHKNIKVWAHTDLIAEHRNQNWQTDIYTFYPQL